MRNSLLTRAARASGAGTLFLSLTLTPALRTRRRSRPGARIWRRGRAILPRSPFAVSTASAFTDSTSTASPLAVSTDDRFGFKRFGFDRSRFNRFRWNGWNGNAWNWNQSGLAGWGYWGYPSSAPATPAAPIIGGGGGGPPVAINVYAGGAGPGEVGGGGAGACVIHLLKYDQAGTYTGEEQIPQC